MNFREAHVFRIVICISALDRSGFTLEVKTKNPYPGSDLLSHDISHSIIGPGGLNFRVRNGNGCFPSGMATGIRIELKSV